MLYRVYPITDTNVFYTDTVNASIIYLFFDRPIMCISRYVDMISHPFNIDRLLWRYCITTEPIEYSI